MEAVLMKIYKLFTWWKHLRHLHVVRHELVTYFFQLIISKRMVGGHGQVPQSIFIVY